MSIEAMKQALDSAEGIANADWRKWEELASPEEFVRWAKSRAAQMATVLRAAIEEAEKREGWVLREVLFNDGEPISHREHQWVGLTDEEQLMLALKGAGKTRHGLVCLTENALREKNCGR